MGSQIIYYGRRLVSEALIAPNYRVKIGSRSIAAPVFLRESSRLVRDWAPDWKTEIIGRYVRARPGTFIDVGTNIGDTLLDFLTHSDDQSNYIGFEPNPASAHAVSTLIERNRISNATLVPIGLSNRSGLIEFFTRVGHPTDAAGTLLADVRPGWSYDRHLVPCFRFSDIADDLKIKDISLIKIDVEGAELLVLEGMKEKLGASRPPVLCEVLHRDKDADATSYSRNLSQILLLLSEIDYAIFRVVGRQQGALSFVRCAGFPDLVYGSESAYDCDYLLLPSETSPLE